MLVFDKMLTISFHKQRQILQSRKVRKKRVGMRSILTRRSQWSSQPSGSAQLSSRETFISKLEAKSISEINNLCEVIHLYMFTCLSLLWMPPAEFYSCNISCRSLFVLLLVQSQGFLWTIIHGVIHLAFSAIRK